MRHYLVSISLYSSLASPPLSSFPLSLIVYSFFKDILHIVFLIHLSFAIKNQTGSVEQPLGVAAGKYAKRTAQFTTYYYHDCYPVLKDLRLESRQIKRLEIRLALVREVVTRSGNHV